MINQGTQPFRYTNKNNLMMMAAAAMGVILQGGENDRWW